MRFRRYCSTYHRTTGHKISTVGWERSHMVLNIYIIVYFINLWSVSGIFCDLSRFCLSRDRGKVNNYAVWEANFRQRWKFVVLLAQKLYWIFVNKKCSLLWKMFFSFNGACSNVHSDPPNLANFSRVKIEWKYEEMQETVKN